MAENPHLSIPPREYGCAAGDATLAVILVHGRGQSPEWMHDAVVRRLARSDIAWHAPAAAEASWYPERFVAPLEANEPNLTHALDALDAVSDGLRAQGIPYASQVLMGFSQGACLCSEFVWRRRRRYRALVAFTGGLIGPRGSSVISIRTRSMAFPFCYRHGSTTLMYPPTASARRRCSSHARAPA